MSVRNVSGNRWQGSAGNRCPYADLMDNTEVIHRLYQTPPLLLLPYCLPP